MYSYIKLWILFVLCYFVNNSISAQLQNQPEEESISIESTEKEENIWKTLSKITYKKEYDEFLGFKIDVPVFSEKVTALHEQEVSVKGYIIPVEGYKSHTEFILSAFPYNMCFFCGGAGPETVMEVESLDPVEYTTEQVILKGKLVLNDSDINRLMYLLVDAKLQE